MFSLNLCVLLQKCTFILEIGHAEFGSGPTVSAHLFGHVSGEEEVRQRSEEEEAGRHQEAEPPGSDPAQVLRGQLDLIWRKKRITNSRLLSNGNKED